MSAVHLRLEMALCTDVAASRDSTTDIPVWQRSEWISQTVRDLGAIETGAAGEKLRVPPTDYQVRVYPLSPRFVREVLGDADPPPEASPLSFCNPAPGACAECRFQAAGTPP